MLTLIPKFHFQLHRLELVRNASFGFSAHSLARPLLKTPEFLVDIHCGDVC